MAVLPVIVAIAMVRDEADVIGYTISHLLAEGVDRVVVADNLSRDDTRPILEEFADALPVTVLDDLEVGYYQARKMTALAVLAADMGADWVLPFDADELFYSPHGTIAQALDECPADVVLVRGWDHIPTARDRPNRNPYRRIIHRRPIPQKLPKVAFRPTNGMALHMGNHNVDHPGTRVEDVLELRHLGHRSFAQFVRKVRNGKQAYDATDLHHNYGTHWRIRGGLPTEALMAEWQELIAEPGLICDPAPYRRVIHHL